MAILFPSSPSVGQTVTVGNVIYTWDGTKWYTNIPAPSSYLPLTGGTLTGSVTVSTTAPQIVLAETDQTLPAGRRRLRLEGNIFALNRNTAAAGDFSTSIDDLSVDASSNFTASGNITAFSDERLKTDWLSLPADFVERLAAVKSGTYTRTDNGERQAGSSAQDWQTLLPEVVLTGTDDEKILSLAYGNAALVAAIELAKRVVQLEAMVAELQSNKS